MRRLVLLGASNVRRGLPAVVETARGAWGPDLEIFGAFGHGRSYGTRSCIPFRCLPGILECGLWEALAGSAPAQETAVVTDVGNDVVYGAPVPAILGWVGECLERLAARGAAIRVTGLPVARLRRVSPAEYLFFRTLFFRGSRVAWRRAIDAVGEVDAGIRRLAAGAGATIIDPPGDWYGADPIHVRRRDRAAAWAEILGVAKLPAPMPLGEALRLRAAAPDVRWLAGVERRRRQPAFAAPDGLRVALY